MEIQIVLQPIIAELLRTQSSLYPPVLRVEKMIETPYPREGSFAKDFRLLLSDGELMMQAALHHTLHYCLHDGQIMPGYLLKLLKFDIHSGRRLTGTGFVYYFAIYDLEIKHEI